MGLSLMKPQNQLLKFLASRPTLLKLLQGSGKKADLDPVGLGRFSDSAFLIISQVSLMLLVLGRGWEMLLSKLGAGGNPREAGPWWGQMGPGQGARPCQGVAWEWVMLFPLWRVSCSSRISFNDFVKSWFKFY